MKLQYGQIGGMLGMTWIDANERADEFINETAGYLNIEKAVVLEKLKNGSELKRGNNGAKIRDFDSIKTVPAVKLQEPDYCSNDY